MGMAGLKIRWIILWSVTASLLVFTLFAGHCDVWAAPPTEYGKDQKEKEGKFLPQHLRDKQKKIEGVIELKQELTDIQGLAEPIPDTLEVVMAAPLGAEIQTDLSAFTEDVLRTEDVVQAYFAEVESAEFVMDADVGQVIDADTRGYKRGEIWHIWDVLQPSFI